MKTWLLSLGFLGVTALFVCVVIEHSRLDDILSREARYGDESSALAARLERIERTLGRPPTNNDSGMIPLRTSDATGTRGDTAVGKDQDSPLDDRLASLQARVERLEQTMGAWVPDTDPGSSPEAIRKELDVLRSWDPIQAARAIGAKGIREKRVELLRRLIGVSSSNETSYRAAEELLTEFRADGPTSMAKELAGLRSKCSLLSWQWHVLESDVSLNSMDYASAEATLADVSEDGSAPIDTRVWAMIRRASALVALHRLEEARSCLERARKVGTESGASDSVLRAVATEAEKLEKDR